MHRSSSKRSLAAAVVVVSAAAGSSYWYLDAQTIANRCGSDHPAADGFSHEWNWWPFAYVCVYTDRRGNEIARRFPDRPHPRDLG